MQVKKAITYFYSIIDNNIKAFLAVIFQGILLGIFLQAILVSNLQNDFLNYWLIIIISISVIGFIFLWITYAFIISKLFFGDLSRGAIHEILRYDVLAYLPLTISIIIGLVFFNATDQSNYLLWTCVVGLILMIFSKILIIIYKPPNKEIYLAEKAQQIKIKHVNATNNLEPDKGYIERFEVDNQYPVRKYIVNDELRNAINLKNSKSGTLKIKTGPSDVLHYAIGWNSKETYPNGNLKLYICEDQKEEMIFNKDAAYLLDGWNEYQIEPKGEKKTIEIKWENTIKNDVYLSISNLSTIKLKDHKKNIIVIIFDGVHRDSIGLYQGNPDADVISNFFQDSMIFTNAYAQGEWTMPNFVLMATSLYQTHHGVYDPDLYSKEMPTSNKTLAETLQQNGYNTFGYVGHNRVSPGYGHARGYNRFIYRCTYDEFTKRYNERKGGEYDKDVKISDIRKMGNDNKDITLNAIKFLRDNQKTNNFLFLHYFDTHQPFFQSPSNISTIHDALNNKNIQETLQKTELQDDDFAFLHELYMQKYREVNDNISLLLDYITKYENDCTTVIFTTDHGTIIFDQETKSLLAPGKGGRENYLTQSIMKVPFMIRTPGKTASGGKIINDIIEANITILPTVLEIAEIKPPNNIDGVSIMRKNNNGLFGKGYAIAESCYKDRYELFLKTINFDYFLRAGRDRVTNEILIDPGIETFYDTNGTIITEIDKINKLKEEIEGILENNDLSNILKR